MKCVVRAMRNDNTTAGFRMTEFTSDVPEEKEAVAVAAAAIAETNVTTTCDTRHCREMRKEKLPPYLRDRGMNL